MSSDLHHTCIINLTRKVPAQARMRRSVNIEITFKNVQTPRELHIPSVTVSVGHSGRMSRPLRTLQNVWFDYVCITSSSFFILYFLTFIAITDKQYNNIRPMIVICITCNCVILSDSKDPLFLRVNSLDRDQTK